MGGLWTLGQVVVANSFGLEHIGAIRGARCGAPLRFGLVSDVSESYGLLFAIAVAGWAVSLVGSFFLRPRASAAVPRLPSGRWPARPRAGAHKVGWSSLLLECRLLSL